MTEFLDYSPRDFLLFAEGTYWRLFELHNAALWPLQPVALLLVAGLLGLALGGWRRAGVAVGLGLAALWAGVAALFLEGRYEPINWAVAYVSPFWWAEAVLLIALGWSLAFARSRRPGAWLHASLVVAALAWPLVGLAAGRPPGQAEVAGIAPDPTAAATLGLVGLAAPDWRRLALSVVPLGWLAASAVTLLTLDTPGAWAAPAALGLALLARGLDHAGGLRHPRAGERNRPARS